MKRPHVQAVIDKIHGVPHRLIVIQPLAFRPSRFPKLHELWETAKQSKVSIIGWDFPHIGHRKHETGESGSFIWSVCDWEDHHQEYWELHKSGQFVWLGTFSDLNAERLHTWYNDNAPQLSFVSQLYDFTEAFEFAARYSKNGRIVDGIRIALEHRNMKGLVVATDFRLTPINAEPCLEQEFSIERNLSQEEALTRNRLEALSCFEEFLAYFQANIRRDILKKHQDEYYNYRGLGEDTMDRRHSAWPEDE